MDDTTLTQRLIMFVEKNSIRQLQTHLRRVPFSFVRNLPLFFHATTRRMVTLLYEYGLRTDMVDASNQTAFYHLDFSLFEGLEKAIDLAHRDAKGNTLLMHMVMYRGNCVTAVRALLVAGSDPNAANNDGRTPLFYAATVSIAQLLLDYRADATHRDHYRNTVVMVNRHADVVRRLLQKNPQLVDERNCDGNTALFTQESAYVVKALLDHGATPTLRNHRGLTAIQHAITKNDLMLELHACIRETLKEAP